MGLSVGGSVDPKLLTDVDKLAKELEAAGQSGKKLGKELKGTSAGFAELAKQVAAVQTPLTQMISTYQKGTGEFGRFRKALSSANAIAKDARQSFVQLATTGTSWIAVLDKIYSIQLRGIVNLKAEIQAQNLIDAGLNKAIALRAEMISIREGEAAVISKLIAVEEAELAIQKAKHAGDAIEAQQLKVNTILRSGETLEIKRQALALAGIPPLKMAVAAATQELTVAETGYSIAAVRSTAQTTRQGMALELLSVQSKKRSALLSQLNALENGYTAALARSLAPLQARVALSQAKNAADIASAKQITVNTILASGETLEIKRQALALAGIPPLKMAVAAASTENALAANAEATATTRVATATTAAGASAKGASGAFTMFGSAVRGAAGAMGMLWFAYGQLLPLMAAFATVSSTVSAFKIGAEFEYTVKMIQTLSKDIEGAETSIGALNKELLHMEGLRHTPLELAKGMKEFAKAGVAPADALRDLATMSKFATIAEMDLGEAIKRVIGLTLAFKPSMEKATGELFTFADAANMTAAAAMLTITDVDEMANAFAYAAELGVVSGMKFQEVAAALGIMANAGIRGTKGATSLRMGMIKLQTATDPVLLKIKSLTKSVTGMSKEFTAFHEDGSAKNIVELFRDLNKVLAGLPDKERVQIFADLFTARSLRAGAVISQQVKELESFIKKLEEAAEGVGFIEEKYQDLAQTAKAEWDFMRVAFQQMLLAFSVEGLGLDVIGDSLAGITSGIKAITPAMQELGSVLGTTFGTMLKLSKELWVVINDLNKFAIGGLPLGDLGLIGYILFRSSPQAAAIVAFLWATNEALKVFGKDAKSTADSLKRDYGDLGTIIEQSLEVLTGKRDWNTGAVRSIEGLAVASKRLSNELQASHDPIVKTLDDISKALEAFYGYEDIDIKVRVDAEISSEATALLDKLFPELKEERDIKAARETLSNLNLAGYFKDMPGGYEEALKRLNETTTGFQEQKKAIEESNKVWEDHKKELQSAVDKYLPLKKEADDVKTAQNLLNEAFDRGYINAEQLTTALDNVTKSTTAYKNEQEKLAAVEKIRQEYQKWNEKYEEEQSKLRLKRAKTLSDIYEELAKGSPDMTEKYLKAQREAIKDEIDIIRDELKIDDVLLDALEQKRMEELFIKAARASGDFIAGFKAGMMDAGTAFEQLGELGYQTFYDLKSAFHDTFYKALKGDFDSIADLWESLLDKMLDRFLSFLADMLTEWTMKGLSALLTGSGSGGGGILGAIGSAIGSALGGGGGGGGGGLLGSLATSAVGKYILGKLGLGGVGKTALSGVTQYLGGTGLGQTTSQQVANIAAKYAAEAAAEAAATAAAKAAATYYGSGTYGVMASQGGALPTSGTGYYFGAGAKSATPASGGAGSMAGYASLAAVIVAGITTFMTFQSKRQAPRYNDFMNAAGFRPADFASLMGEEFKKALDPIYGKEVMAKFDNATDTLLMYSKEQAVNQKRAYESTLGRPYVEGDEFLGRPEMSMLRWTGDTWKGGTSLMFDMIKDMADTMGVEFRKLAIDTFKLSPSLVDSYLQFQEDIESSLDRTKDAMKDAGLAGYELQKAMELAAATENGLIGSTLELEKYLRGLGKTEDQIANITSNLVNTQAQQRSQIDQLRLGLKELGLSMEDLPGLAIDATGKVTYFGQAVGDLSKGLENAAGGLGEAVRRMTIDLRQSVNPLTGLTETLEDIPRAAERASRSLEEMMGYMASMPGLDAPYAAAVGGANGGRIGYATGGLLRGGSGVTDDLYLGTVNGRVQLAKGGEYIVNPESTAKHLSLLKAINADRYALGGLPPKGTSLPPSGGSTIGLPLPKPASTIRTAVGDDLEELREIMREVAIEAAKFGRTKFENAIVALQQEMAKMYQEAQRLGASEQDLIDIRQYEQLQLNELYAERRKAQEDFNKDIQEQIWAFGKTDVQKAIRASALEMEEAMRAAEELGIGEAGLADIRKLHSLQVKEILAQQQKAQKDFNKGIQEQLWEFGKTDLQKAIHKTVLEMKESIAAAKELGIGEQGLADIRKLQALQVEELMRQQKKAQDDFMQGINDQIAGFGMSDLEKELLANQRAMEAAVESAKELGLGESDLAKVRQLYGLQAAEIMNKGLTEALDTMKSFKDSMAGVEDQAIRSATAQQQLFTILSQARAGDFSGVEKIGEVLKNISIDKSKYATAADYARDYWKTMGAVSELEQLTQNQIASTVPSVDSVDAAVAAAAEAAEAAAASMATAVTTITMTSAGNTAELVAEIRALKDSLVAGNVQLSKNTGKTARLLDRWEAIGLPDTRAA